MTDMDQDSAGLFIDDDDRGGPAASVLEMLRGKGLSVACAESLTGGRVADSFVCVPGASDTFRGGVVAYIDDVKAHVLGVDPQVLQEQTAYSAEVAAQMAVGACALFAADFGISTTGVAGPGPDQGFAPGSGFVAVARGNEVVTMPLKHAGTREEVREAFTRAALTLALQTLQQPATKGH